MAARLLSCLASSLHSKRSIAGDVLTTIRPFSLAKAEREAFLSSGSSLYVTGRIRVSHRRVSLSRSRKSWPKSLVLDSAEAIRNSEAGYEWGSYVCDIRAAHYANRPFRSQNPS